MKKYLVLILIITTVFSGCSLSPQYTYTDVYTQQELTENKSGVISDAKNPEENTEKSPEVQASEDDIVYITKSGKKYHTVDCPHLKKSKLATTIAEATNSGLTACSSCNPDKR